MQVWWLTWLLSLLCMTLDCQLLGSLPASWKLENHAKPPHLWKVPTGQIPRSHLEHVHHLLEIRGAKSRRLLHGEALKVLNDTEAIDLCFLILQQLLQNETICLQNLEAQGLAVWLDHKPQSWSQAPQSQEHSKQGLRSNPQRWLNLRVPGREPNGTLLAAGICHTCPPPRVHANKITLNVTFMIRSHWVYPSTFIMLETTRNDLSIQ